MPLHRGQVDQFIIPPQHLRSLSLPKGQNIQLSPLAGLAPVILRENAWMEPGFVDKAMLLWRNSDR